MTLQRGGIAMDNGRPHGSQFHAGQSTGERQRMDAPFERPSLFERIGGDWFPYAAAAAGLWALVWMLARFF